MEQADRWVGSLSPAGHFGYSPWESPIGDVAERAERLAVVFAIAVAMRDSQRRAVGRRR